MSDTDKGDLAVLFPERDVKLSTGEVLELRPFAFGKLPRAIRLLRPVTDAVRSAGIAGFDGTTFTLARDWPLRLPQLMDEAGEALVEFVGFAIGKPREWFDELGADDGIALTKAAFEVNGDFFARRVAPMLGMSIPQPSAATGEPSQPGSATTATPGTTSNA